MINLKSTNAQRLVENWTILLKKISILFWVKDMSEFCDNQNVLVLFR